MQVMLFSSQPFGPSSMRELNSNRVSQLVQISGIITSASKPKVSKAVLLTKPDQTTPAAAYIS